MAEPNGFQKFLAEAADFFRTLIERIKKADRRLLIMIAAAVVLLIVIIALIAHGVSAGKEKKEPASANTPVVVQEQTTDDEPDHSAVLPNGTGTYKVTTGSDSDLNMRLAADRNSDVVTRIPNGTELQILFVDDSGVETSSDYGWGYVEYNGERGWVYMEYMAPVK